VRGTVPKGNAQRNGMYASHAAMKGLSCKVSQAQGFGR
jgi:hypothetical protein